MSPDRSVSIHVSRLTLWVLAVVLIAPWALFAAWLWHTHEPSNDRHAVEAPAAATSTDPTRSPTFTQAHPGPWGNVSYFRILLEPPEEFILTNYIRTEQRPWVFKGYTDSMLAALWQAANLTAEQIKFLTDPAHREIRADAIVVHANADLSTSLSPESRAKIYTALGEFPENFAQYNPFRLRTVAVDGWLENADLPADAVALTKKLFYQRGTATCFSDDDVVLPTIALPNQRLKYLKALSRKSAIVMQLHVSPGEDVDLLVAYWAQGGRSKDLKPLLQSLSRLPNGGSIDIVHLIPRFARLLLYTYPLPSEKAIDASHDCHWTSFNFQNDQPDERFSDIGYVRKVLLEQYYPVPGDPTLGDIIMFVRKDGVVVHSCVYIADDIVFTKNGPAYSVPWLLTPLADVQAFYAATPGVEMRRYRAKSL